MNNEQKNPLVFSAIVGLLVIAKDKGAALRRPWNAKPLSVEECDRRVFEKLEILDAENVPFHIQNMALEFINCAADSYSQDYQKRWKALFYIKELAEAILSGFDPLKTVAQLTGNR